MSGVDFGPQGGGTGPWISWHALEARDGSIRGRSFSLSDNKVRTQLDISQVVADVNTLRLGWIHSARVAGQAPQKQWNKSLRRFDAAPGPQKTKEQDGWVRGFSIRLAIGNGVAATLEQDGVGAFKGVQNMIDAIPDFDQMLARIEAGEALAELPLLTLGPPEKIEGKTITFAPTWTFGGMVPRPACLKPGAQGESGQAQAAPAQTAAPPAQQAPPPVQPTQQPKFAPTQF